MNELSEKHRSDVDTCLLAYHRGIQELKEEEEHKREGLEEAYGWQIETLQRQLAQVVNESQLKMVKQAQEMGAYEADNLATVEKLHAEKLQKAKDELERKRAEAAKRLE